MGCPGHAGRGICLTQWMISGSLPSVTNMRTGRICLLALAAMLPLGFSSGQDVGKKVDGAFLAAPNLHVYEDIVHGGYKVAPVYPAGITSMGGKVVFDVSKVVKEGAVLLDEGDLVLYDASSRVLFYRGTRENFEMLRTLYEAHTHERPVMKVLLVAGKGEEIPDGKTGKILFEGFSSGGEALKIGTGDGEGLEIIPTQGVVDEKEIVALKMKGALFLDGKRTMLDDRWMLEEPGKMSLLKMRPVPEVTSRVYVKFEVVEAHSVFGKSREEQEKIAAGVGKELEAAGLK